MVYTFKVSLQEEDDGDWSAWIDSLPGCADWGRTKEEALEELKISAKLYIESLVKYGDPIPNDHVEVENAVTDDVVKVIA